MKFHNFKMIAGLAILFIIGGLQALHGQANWVDPLIALLIGLEHMYFGNTES